MNELLQYLPWAGMVLTLVAAVASYYKYRQYLKTYADLRLYDSATIIWKGVQVTITLEEIKGNDFTLAVKKPQYRNPTYHKRRLMPGEPLLDGIGTKNASLLITQHPILHNQVRVKLVAYHK